MGEQLGHEGLPLDEGGRAANFAFLTTDDVAFLVGCCQSDANSSLVDALILKLAEV